MNRNLTGNEVQAHQAALFKLSSKYNRSIIDFVYFYKWKNLIVEYYRIVNIDGLEVSFDSFIEMKLIEYYDLKRIENYEPSQIQIKECVEYINGLVEIG